MNSMCLTPKNESSVLESFFPILYIYFSKSTKRKCHFSIIVANSSDCMSISALFIGSFKLDCNIFFGKQTLIQEKSRRPANWQELTFIFLVVTPVIVLSSFLRGLGRAVFSVLWSTLSLVVFITIR